jgi:beta-1,4-mannosyl-glycoprotein beta-1,4-N-acetylglucosaminyltransferase
MIYSIAMFYDEIDLLDLKVKEESPHVDKIIIVESEITHSGRPKPINFPTSKYDQKVEHLIVKAEVFADCPGRWDKEVRQRDYAMSQLEIADDDIFIVTDLDEIINGEKIEEIIQKAREHGIVRACMRLFFYYINVFQPKQAWPHPFAVTGKRYKENPSLSYLRTGPDRNNGDFHGASVLISNCGNHFAWMGGVEKIEEKFNNFCHTEYDTPEIRAGIRERFEKLQNVIARFDTPDYVIVDIDELHPRTIRENIAEWNKYIRNKEM